MMWSVCEMQNICGELRKRNLPSKVTGNTFITFIITSISLIATIFTQKPKSGTIRASIIKLEQITIN
jgi:hypothetical protein